MHKLHRADVLQPSPSSLTLRCVSPIHFERVGPFPRKIESLDLDRRMWRTGPTSRLTCYQCEAFARDATNSQSKLQSRRSQH